MRRWSCIPGATACLPLLVSVAAWAGHSPNLLANASFRLSANGETPDYWDVHHAAVMALPGLALRYGYSDGPSDPVRGARTVRIASPGRDFPFLYFMSYRSRSSAAQRTYTFSVYVRGDHAGMRVAIAPSYEAIDASRAGSSDIGIRWRRLQAVFHVEGGAPLPSPVLVLPSRGTYWISAPQLEPGATASGFEPADADEPATTSAAARRLRDAAAFGQLPGLLSARPTVAQAARPTGMAGVRGLVVGGSVPPESYFVDAAAHGFNTLFFFPAVRLGGALRVDDLDAVLLLARKHGLGLVVGPAVMGPRDPSWAGKLARFESLVDRYRGEDAILAWWAVDEPQSGTIASGELRTIHDSIKRHDPARPVFVNWNSDDVPIVPGAEPHGSLSATDIYSTDCYPFMDERSSQGQCVLRLASAFTKARSMGMPAFSFVQMYGTLDAYREPTPSEARFMAYLHLLFGAGYAGWAGRPNAAGTWDALALANREIDALRREFMLDPEAREEGTPTVLDGCLVGRWRRGGETLLLALHLGDSAAPASLTELAGATEGMAIRGYFDGHVQADSVVLGPWEAVAYRLTPPGR